MNDTRRSLFRFDIRLPSHPKSVSITRGVLRSLDRLVDQSVIERLELIMSELVTNAIRHAASSESDLVEIELEAGGDRITATIRDRGKPFALQPQTRPRETAVGGFGLDIVRSLTDTFTVSRHPGGNEVCFMLPVDLSDVLHP